MLPCSIMVINFDDFCSNTQRVVSEVMEFVGVDPQACTYRDLPVGMKVWGRGRCGGVWGGGGGLGTEGRPAGVHLPSPARWHEGVGVGGVWGGKEVGPVGG